MILISAFVFAMLLGAYPLFLKRRLNLWLWVSISAVLSLIVGLLIFALAMSNYR